MRLSGDKAKRESAALFWENAATHRSVKNTMDINLRMLFDSIPRECSTKHAAGLLTYCSFVQPSHLIGSDLDMEQTILQITAAGLCQNLTGFPKTECGCKGTTKFADVQILSGKSF